MAISPVTGSHCRFYPSCSQYMLDSVKSKGVVKGVCLGFKRLVKCHPWHRGGVDLPSE